MSDEKQTEDAEPERGADEARPFSNRLLERIEFDAIQATERYEVLLLCSDCGNELNRTCEMSGAEIKERWTRLVIGSGFNAGRCKNGCRSTFSDLNINTDMVVVRSNKY